MTKVEMPKYRGIDLLEDTATAYLVSHLCCEARVCMDDDTLPYENPMVVCGALWNVQDGLVVQDNKGKWYQLVQTAWPITEPLSRWDAEEWATSVSLEHTCEKQEKHVIELYKKEVEKWKGMYENLQRKSMEKPNDC